MKSILTLNNNTTHEITVAITIFNVNGEPLQLNRITLNPGITDVSLEELTKEAQNNFDSGNIQVKYHGESMAVTCQVGVLSPERRLSFEPRDAEMMDFMSSNLNGIVWLPDREAEAFVALTNIDARRVTVHFSLAVT